MAIVTRKNSYRTRYQVRVKDGEGKWYPSQSFDSMAEAKEHEAYLAKEKRRGLKALTEDARTVTVGEYWEVWSVENRPQVSEGWKITEDQMYRDYVSPVLADKLIKEVGKPEIGRVLNRAKDKGLSDQTRKHIYSLMRKMFADAVDYYEMMAVSPVNAKFHRPKVKGKKRDFLLPAQAWQLLKHVRDHQYGPPIWIQTLAAFRVEAVQGLDWKDGVLWELDQFLIKRAWKQKIGQMEDFPKGKDWEYVPMPPLLKDYLQAHWKAQGNPKSGFVCRGVKGGMLPYETYNRAITRLCKQISIPPMTTHELRHTCTEIYVQAGASQEDLRRLLNHASLSATGSYIHRTDERLQGIAGTIKNVVRFPKSFPTGKKEAVRLAAKRVVEVGQRG